MPFGSYEASKEQAFASAARVMKETGCGAIKLEGGRRMAETIAFLVERGVPVMGHVGLTPQAINTHRLVPRAGPRRKRLGADRSRRPRGGGCRRILRRARGDGRAARPPHHGRGRNPDHRHRRQRGLRRPDPGAGGHARACRRGCRNSSSALASSDPRSSGRSRATPRRCAARTFPGPDHVYPMRKPRSTGSEAAWRPGGG